MASREPARKVGLSDVTGNRLDGDRMLTIEEAAYIVNLPVATCRKQRTEGKFIPGYAYGKYVRFKRSDVLEWLESHRDEV